MQSADKTVAFAERQAIADDRPHDRDNSHKGKALHHGGQNVFLAHQAAIEKRQPRPGHQQDERRAHEHPCIVG